MSRREILAMTTEAEWALWRAGRCLAHRDDMMHNAANYKTSRSEAAMRTCVKAAREWNHDYLKRIAEYRAIKAAEMPKRKRA